MVQFTNLRYTYGSPDEHLDLQVILYEGGNDILLQYTGLTGPVEGNIGIEGPADLTCHDIQVLKILAERRGEVVPRIDIVEEVCGLDSEATLRTVDNHIVALRRAIGDNPRRPRWLYTVRGEGYRLAKADNG